MDGFTASRTRAPHTASTEAAPRKGRGPGTPPTPRFSPAAQATHNRRRQRTARKASGATRLANRPPGNAPHQAPANPQRETTGRAPRPVIVAPAGPAWAPAVCVWIRHGRPPAPILGLLLLLL